MNEWDNKCIDLWWEIIEGLHERACKIAKTSEQRRKKVVVANAISAERHNTEINKWLRLT